MNSLLRIQVRVEAKQATTQLRVIRTELRAIAMEAARVSAATASMNNLGRSARRLSTPLRAANTQLAGVNANLAKTAALNAKHRGILGGLNTAINGASTAASKGLLGMSKNLQWIGRQLNFNFTIPLSIAAGMAMKWALETEAAFVRVRKVYGDSSRPLAEYNAELDKIAVGTRLLSDLYGVAQSDVNELAASFAAAGAEGGALLRSVESGLQLQILGEYENIADTFSGLLTIQRAFNLNAEETAGVIALLNTVENRTAADLPGLVEGIEKAGSTAYATGVNFRELAAAIAAMTPTAGGPEEIGTSLKTMFSRIVDPTTDIKNAFDAIGFSIQDMLDSGMGAMQIMEEIAKATGDLTDSERGRYASLFGGRRQMNRVLALWNDLISAESVYYKVIKDLDPANDLKNIAVARNEIQTLLSSDPQKLKIITNQLKNLAIDAVAPLIPFLIGLAGALREVFTWFSELDPKIQKYVAYALAATVATGVLAQFIGSLGLLFGTLGNFLLKPLLLMGGLAHSLARVLGPLGQMMVNLVVSPWGIALAAAVGILYLFRDDVKKTLVDLWEFILRGFNTLPEGIANAMRSVVDILARAVNAISSFFSSLFGIQTKSNVDIGIPRPSVANPTKFHTGGVVKGTGEVPAALMGGEMVLTAKQQAELFRLATAGIRSANTASVRQGQLETVGGTTPAAVPVMKDLFLQLDSLEGALANVGSELELQQTIVDNLDDAYTAAKKAVEDFESSMEPLADEIDRLNTVIQDAEGMLTTLSQTPLKGMGKMEDAIFGNELATKKLRLELLQLGDAGNSYEDIRDKIASINGDIEMLSGRMESLRSSGAGSEILSVYDDQIKALEKQKDGLRDSANAATDLEDQIGNLERAGQILSLQQDITFDPLVRQIDQMVNGVDEMSFDDVVAQVTEQKKIIEQTTVELAKRQKEYDAQNAKLEILKTSEKDIGDTLDAEKIKLEDINDAYENIKSTISDIEKLISDTVSAQESLNKAGAAGAAGSGLGFDPYGGGDFPDPTIPKDEFGFEDLDAMIADLDQRLKDAWKDFDVLAPLKEKWAELQDWFNGLSIDPKVIKGIGAGLGLVLANSLLGPWGLALAAVALGFYLFQDEIMGFIDSVGGSSAFKHVEDAFNRIGEVVGKFVAPAFEQIKKSWPDIEKAGESIGRNVGPIFEALGRVIGGVVLAVNPFLDALAGIAGAFLGLEIAGLITEVSAALQIVFEAFGFIANLINGDWSAAWDNLEAMFGGFLQLVVGPFEDVKNFLIELGPILGTELGNVGTAMMDGFIDGLNTAFRLVMGWFIDMPFSIMTKLRELLGIASPSTVFAQLGMDLMEGLLQGLITGVVAVMTWFTELPGKVLGWIGDVSLTLAANGRGLIGGLKDGAVEKLVAVNEWFASVPGRVAGAVGGTFLTLFFKGAALLTGLKNGAVEGWNLIKGWFGGIGDAILGAVGNIATKLWSAGFNLIGGFKDGITAGWNWFANWWNSKIGSWGVSIPDFVPGWLGGGKSISVPNAPILHKGGVVPGQGDVASILRAGEMVLTNRQQAQLFNLANRKTQYSNDSGSKREVNFYGNLSFPNITDPNDAERFIENLEALAGAGN